MRKNNDIYVKANQILVVDHESWRVEHVFPDGNILLRNVAPPFKLRNEHIDNLRSLLNITDDQPIMARTLTEAQSNRLERQRSFQSIWFTLKNQDAASAVHIAAASVGINSSTGYRWIKAWSNGQSGPAQRADRGQLKIHPDAEHIVQDSINKALSSKRAAAKQDLLQSINIRLVDKGLPTISYATLSRRISDLPLIDRNSIKYGPQLSGDLKPTGKGEVGELPLELVEIDHWMVDLIILNDADRQPVGVAYITLLEDTATRMVLGYYLSFDYPSAVSVGKACMHAFLPKEETLQRLGLPGAWPCYGKPKKIRPDNAKEFTSEMFTWFASKHEFKLVHARRRKPQDKAKIEAFFGTLSKYIRYLPGATKASTKNHKSCEKDAIYTLSEFEKEFVDFVVNKYHRSMHEKLQSTPLKAYERGIQLVNDLEFVLDTAELRIDILPQITSGRCVSQDGVTLHNIPYWSDNLLPLINDGRKYPVKYDPQDLSVIWIYVKDQYFPLQYKDLGFPKITLRELKDYKRRYRETNRDASDIHAVMEYFRRRDERIEESTRLTQNSRTSRKDSKTNTPIAQKALTPKVTEQSRAEWLNNLRLFKEDDS